MKRTVPENKTVWVISATPNNRSDSQSNEINIIGVAKTVEVANRLVREAKQKMVLQIVNGYLLCSNYHKCPSAPHEEKNFPYPNLAHFADLYLTWAKKMNDRGKARYYYEFNKETQTNMYDDEFLDTMVVSCNGIYEDEDKDFSQEFFVEEYQFYE